MKNIFLFYVLMFSINTYAQTSAYSSPRQYNQYQETTDFALLQRVLSTKQNQYDKNIEKVYDKTSNISKLITKLYVSQNYEFTENQQKYLNSYYQFVESITKTQLSNNSETYSILKTLEGVEDQLYKILYP